MACPRGAASPNTHTRLKLFANSGGFCQNPACHNPLFLDLPEKSIHISEMAHVFAATDTGPRAKPQLSKTERGAFENLILLCPICHTIIDKAPAQYPDTIILGWKRSNRDKLHAIFGIVSCSSRADARKLIEPVLRGNRAIFQLYGPNIEDAFNPESGAAERWKRKVLTSIIPNNRRILAQLDANIDLMSQPEIDTLEEFRQHVDDFEARHLENYKEGGRTFPTHMDRILIDDHV